LLGLGFSGDAQGQAHASRAGSPFENVTAALSHGPHITLTIAETVAYVVEKGAGRLVSVDIDP